MKTKILLIRHAKTIANENGLFGGITDYPLSKLGELQASQLCDKITSLNYNIENIYSSPLIRAIKTIEPTAKRLNKEIIKVDNLKEIYVGTWEDKLREDLRKQYPETNKYIDETEYYTGMEEQEDTEDVANRMVEVLKNIACINEGKTIIAVSHIVAIRAFLCKVQSIPYEQTKLKIGNIDNTQITTIIYDFENDRFEI